MQVYTIKDFGSSCFTECTSITIYRTVFHFITNHEHQKKAITASEKYACPPPTPPTSSYLVHTWRSRSQAFLAETIKTVNKKHCVTEATHPLKA